jgi:hypothetical protein
MFVALMLYVAVIYHPKPRLIYETTRAVKEKGGETKKK